MMLAEVLEFLRPAPGAKFVDCTVGGAGHSEAIIEGISPGGALVAVDQDPENLERAKRRLGSYKERVSYVQSNFRHLGDKLRDLEFNHIQGVLFDLGISSFQIESAERGFSFRLEGPLDMRMDPGTGSSARDLVHDLSRRDLEALIREFGEERFAGRIARAIDEARQNQRIDTTTELAEIIFRAVPV
ncbi:MAG: 16S rRNA (cytosine(1402)-N(4))-methyltransferase RsmH, partial [Candidatus Omnitrophica bacterium]|nr:16S rRNA (cytosine(1402)-N(4))-methyltransferase RsmH [Candidatus Omnitrophota bacterium]